MAKPECLACQLTVSLARTNMVLTILRTVRPFVSRTFSG
jgi:hypothetical protein